MDVCSVNDDIVLTKQSFTIEIANSREQLREVFRLRHQVYCIERGFEPGVDGEERDEYDVHSRHALLRHAADGEALGTIRVIGPKLTDLRDSFPMQRLCDPSLLSGVPLHTCGEMSRMSISKIKRVGYTNTALLRLALWRAVVQMSSEMNLTHWLAVVERSSIRLHARSGIYFNAVGPLVNHHGIRQPMVGEIETVLEGVRREEFAVWNYLTDGGRWFGRRENVASAA